MNPVYSQQVSWWDVHTFVEPLFTAVNNAWPLVGTPEWCQRDDRDPAKWAALLDAAQHWALRLETCQAARAEGSRAIASAAGWSTVAREVQQRADFYAARPWLTGGIVTGESILDRLMEWFGRFIGVSDIADLMLLTLWTVSTHLAEELYTTPRLLLDSTMPGSGKTTDWITCIAWRGIRCRPPHCRRLRCCPGSWKTACGRSSSMRSTDRYGRTSRAWPI